MLDNIIVRLIVYYIAVLLFFAGLWLMFPEIPKYIAQERGRGGQSTSMTLELQSGVERAAGEGDLFHPQTFVPVSMALLFSFLFALPVTWVYRWTRPKKRYKQAFAHTLLVVPIAIALVVFLVKGSLALAFGLAGIVAAVRFRTTLNEPMDAVYMFIVIGIGLSAGVQLGSVAILASVAFNAVALTIWRMDFGAEPAVLSGWKLVRPGKEGQLLGASGVVEPVLRATNDKAKKPYNAQLRVHTTQVEAAQRATIPLLESNTKQWQQAQVIQKEDGTSIVEFDVRLKKSTDLSAFIREIEKSEKKHVDKVELEKHKPVKV